MTGNEDHGELESVGRDLDALDLDLTRVGSEEFGGGKMGERLVSKELSDVDGEVGKGSWIFKSQAGGRKDEEMWTLKDGRERRSSNQRRRSDASKKNRLTKS